MRREHSQSERIVKMPRGGDNKGNKNSGVIMRASAASKTASVGFLAAAVLAGALACRTRSQVGLGARSILASIDGVDPSDLDLPGLSYKLICDRGNTVIGRPAAATPERLRARGRAAVPGHPRVIAFRSRENQFKMATSAPLKSAPKFRRNRQHFSNGYPSPPTRPSVCFTDPVKAGFRPWTRPASSPSPSTSYTPAPVETPLPQWWMWCSNPTRAVCPRRQHQQAPQCCRIRLA